MRETGTAIGGGCALSCSGLSLGYGGRPVFEGASMEVGPAQTIGLYGANGSGKSTFLRACLGFLVPLAGELSVLGRRPGTRAFRRVLMRIGYVPQQRGPGGLRLSVRDAVRMGRYALAGVARPLTADDDRAAEDAMARAGLEELAGNAVQDLSGGQFQRVCLARAMAARPRLYLLDEPTTHLDTRGRSDVMRLLERLAATRSHAIILVSHDPALLALCDRLFRFGGGAVRETEGLEADHGHDS